MNKEGFLNGFGIVVAERGWVFVGDIDDYSEECIIYNAKNIRKWGTSHGLGELAAEGPTEKTVLDDYGTVRVAKNAKILIIESDKKLWEK